MILTISQARRAFQAPTKSVVVTSSRSKGMGKTQNCFKMVERKLRKSSRTNNRARSTSNKEATEQARKTSRPRESMQATSSQKKRRGALENLFNIVPRMFHRRSSHRDVLSGNRNTCPTSSTEEAITKEETVKVEYSHEAVSSTSPSVPQKEEFTKEDAAAIKIQKVFRGHRVRLSNSLHDLLNTLLLTKNKLSWTVTRVSGSVNSSVHALSKWSAFTPQTRSIPPYNRDDWFSLITPTILFGRQGEHLRCLRAKYQALERRTQEEH